MRVIIIHHILWAHYKNAFYEELQNQAAQTKNLEVKILQIAKSERSREEMPLSEIPTYPHQLLFDAVLESIPKKAIFKAILHEINTFKPQVVNINGFFTWYHILTAVYCKLRGIKIILSNDSTATDNPAVWWKDALKKTMVSLADAYYCFGSRSAEYLLLHGAKPDLFISKRGAVVNNQFVANQFQANLPFKEQLKNELGVGTQKNIIYVGRFIDFKNLPLLLIAFQKSKQPNWGLLLLGDGILKQNLEAQMTTEKIDNIYFLGGKPWQEVPKYLTLADVLVLPSKSEPWGLVVNEAMICGLPVVVSDRCGSAIDLVKEDETGFSFQFDDEKQLVAIFSKIMKNEIDLTTMGANAKEKIKQFSVENAAKDMIDGFLKLGKQFNKSNL